jgi:hypothetical protein
MNVPTTAHTSKPLIFTVKKQEQVRPEKPSVLEAEPYNVLDPANATQGATTLVLNKELRPTDSVTVTWHDTPQTFTWTSDSQLGQPDLIRFPVPIPVVGASVGKAITVKYEFVRNGQTTPSLPLALQVGTFSEDALPRPSVPQADPDTLELDMGSFEGDAQVHIDAWPLMAEKQKYWISGKGKLEDNSEYSFPICDGAEVTAEDLTAGRVSATLPRAELELLLMKGEVTIMASITFDGSGDFGKAQRLRSLPLSLVAGKFEIEVLNYGDYLGSSWEAGETLDTPYCTVTFSGGAGVHENSQKNSFLSTKGSVTINFKKPAKAVFSYSYHDLPILSTMHFYNNENLLKSAHETNYPTFLIAGSEPITRILYTLPSNPTYNISHFAYIILF